MLGCLYRKLLFKGMRKIFNSSFQRRTLNIARLGNCICKKNYVTNELA